MNLTPSSSQFRFAAAEPSERAAVGKFLLSVFHDPQLAVPSTLQWKYFDEREDWRGPRSFVLKRGEDIVAHCGVHPVTFCTDRGEVTGICGLDWAAAPTAPGAGVILLRRLAALADTFVVPGGTAQTRQIIPKIGFIPHGNRDVYARVIRPWKRLLARPGVSWKTPVRLARDLAWNLAAIAPPDGWSAVRIVAFGDSELPILLRRTERLATACRRTPQILNYMLACPGVSASAFLLFSGGLRRGYFVLSRIGNQVRIGDISLDSESAADWQAGYSLATRTAEEYPDVDEVIAAASTALGREALARNGFHLQRRRSLLLLDPKGLLHTALPLDLQFLDGDEFYLL